MNIAGMVCWYHLGNSKTGNEAKSFSFCSSLDVNPNSSDPELEPLKRRKMDKNKRKPKAGNRNKPSYEPRIAKLRIKIGGRPPTEVQVEPYDPPPGDPPSPVSEAIPFTSPEKINPEFSVSVEELVNPADPAYLVNPSKNDDLIDQAYRTGPYTDKAVLSRPRKPEISIENLRSDEPTITTESRRPSMTPTPTPTLKPTSRPTPTTTSTPSNDNWKTFESSSHSFETSLASRNDVTDDVLYKPYDSFAWQEPRRRISIFEGRSQRRFVPMELPFSRPSYTFDQNYDWMMTPSSSSSTSTSPSSMSFGGSRNEMMSWPFSRYRPGKCHMFKVSIWWASG